jgi:hypothetical protein
MAFRLDGLTGADLTDASASRRLSSNQVGSLMDEVTLRTGLVMIPLSHRLILTNRAASSAVDYPA